MQLADRAYASRLPKSSLCGFRPIGPCPALGDLGFSLIELVVVIAILSVLTAIALPNFLSIRKDAHISQAKNALAVILKECAVAQARGLRGGAPLLGDIQAASASLSGFRLVVNNSTSLSDVYSNDPLFQSIPCFQATATPEFRVKAVPIPAMVTSRGNPSMPKFVIGYSASTGATERICLFIKDPEVYGGGCELSSAIKSAVSFFAIGTPVPGFW